MTKTELIKNGFKHVSTQNCEIKTELWARFSGWEDTVQYYYYFPNEDQTSPIIMTTTYMQLEMFAQMRDSLRDNFLKDDIKYNSTQLFVKESEFADEI